MIVRNVRKTMNKMCTSENDKQEALYHLQCFSVEKLPLLLSVVTGWTKVMTHIAGPDTRSDDIIPNMCCAFHYLYDDGIRMLNEQCASTTGNATAEFIIGLLRSAVDDILDIGCQTHKSKEYCDTNMPNEMLLFKNLTEIGMKEPFSVTPIVPILKLATNLHLENL
jgi:hypothetical protein